MALDADELAALIKPDLREKLLAELRKKAEFAALIDATSGAQANFDFVLDALSISVAESVADNLVDHFTGESSLDDLSDVNTTGAVSGSPLEYNGSLWTPGVDEQGTSGSDEDEELRQVVELDALWKTAVAVGYTEMLYHQTIVLDAAGYTPVDVSDVGKEVQDDAVTVGTLVSYDNGTRTWVVLTRAAAVVADASALTIVTGVGAGSADGEGVVNTDDLQQVDVWLSSNKVTKLFTRVLTYTSGDLTQVQTVDEGSGVTLTRTLAYTANGDLDTISRVVS